MAGACSRYSIAESRSGNEQKRADSSRSQTASAFDYLTSQLTPTKEDKASNPEMAELKSAARDTAKDTKQVSDVAFPCLKLLLNCLPDRASAGALSFLQMIASPAEATLNSKVRP